MKIFISENLLTALEKLNKEDATIFSEKTKELESMTKKDILSSNNVIKLTENKKIPFYAYHIDDSTYIVFAFSEKTSIVILDRIILLKNNEIQSLVYPVVEKSE